jgi:hypothetical protein
MVHNLKNPVIIDTLGHESRARKEVSMTFMAEHISVSINRSAAQVYGFAAKSAAFREFRGCRIHAGDSIYASNRFGSV